MLEHPQFPGSPSPAETWLIVPASENSHLITLPMIGISDVSVLCDAIDASYRGHTSVSTCAGDPESLIRLIIFQLDAATSVADSQHPVSLHIESCASIVRISVLFRPNLRMGTRPSRGS